jgi:hypothetical protein
MNTDLLTKLLELRNEVARRVEARDAANLALIDARGALEAFKTENAAALAELRALMEPKRTRSDAGKPRPNARGPRKAREPAGSAAPAA